MDLELVEIGNGGDFIKKPKDLSVVYGFENMIYLGLFGGNVEASTPNQRIESEQDFSFWGNNLLMVNNASIQFNSLTERTLKEVALNSVGRVTIETAVKKDLEFMQPFAVIKVIVTIVSTDRITIGIQLTEPDNLQQKQFIYIWDVTKQELLAREIIVGGGGGSTPGSSKIFGPEFDFSFE